MATNADIVTLFHEALQKYPDRPTIGEIKLSDEDMLYLRHLVETAEQDGSI